MKATRPDNNSNPHAEARMAMNIWGREYAAQNGGCMDFWDTLSEGRKLQCYREVDLILHTRRAPAMAPGFATHEELPNKARSELAKHRTCRRRPRFQVVA